MSTIVYQEIVKMTRQLKLAEQLRLLETLAEQVRQQVEAAPTTRSIMDIEGLGGEIWQGMDAQEYVNKERNAWDS